MMANVFGLFAAANLAVLFGHILAGLSFYFVSNKLSIRRSWSIVGALAFGNSAFIFSRGLEHVVVAFYWHLPLCYLACTQLLERPESLPMRNRQRIYFFCLVGVITGLQNPYYTFMFIQFLALILLFHLAQKSLRRAFESAATIAVTLIAFAITQLDTFAFHLGLGPNPAVANRNLVDLQLYSLQLPDLFLPAFHRFGPLSRFARDQFFGEHLLIQGEPAFRGSSYLGLLSLLGLLGLAAYSIFCAIRSRRNLAKCELIGVLWTLAFSISGGINLLFGVAGLRVFRATNRLSIVVLMLGLFFLIRMMPTKIPKWATLALMSLLVGIHFLDVLPDRAALVESQAKSAKMIESDRRFTEQLESAIPHGMIFQLPVVDFPEVGATNLMQDYEQFRPFLFSKSLSYSYGGVKGRPANGWQRQVARLPAPAMLQALEGYGFAALMINRRGTNDSQSLEQQLQSDGYAITSESILGDLVSYKLRPAKTPIPPLPTPSFSAGWSVDEGALRWAEQKRALIDLWSAPELESQIELNAELGSLLESDIEVRLNDATIAQCHVRPGTNCFIKTGRLALKPNFNRFTFLSSAPPMKPPNGDPRFLSFNISKVRWTIGSLNRSAPEPRIKE
jgi:phosphoglycerol transferase